MGLLENYSFPRAFLTMERTGDYAINHWPALSILNFAGEDGRVRTTRHDGLEDCRWI